jgi:hypothetical protein
MVQAQSYPIRPVRLIVTVPAGSSPDIIGRLSAPPIMDKKDKRANAKKKSPARPKARAGCSAPLASARQWIKRTNAPACVAMLMMS